MTQSVEATTTATLAFALNAASLRQQAIATNIANAHTLGYAPQRVDFASQLEDARRSLEARGSLDPLTLASVRLQVESHPGADGARPDVQLDMETARLAENAVHYQALLKGLSRHLSILSIAVSDGRR